MICKYDAMFERFRRFVKIEHCTGLCNTEGAGLEQRALATVAWLTHISDELFKKQIALISSAA